MKLVLLAGVKPSVMVGPRVRLFAGYWKLCVDGLQDSEICVTCPAELPHAITVANGVCIDLRERGGEVYASILKAGKESHLTLFAEYQHGVEPSTA